MDGMMDGWTDRWRDDGQTDGWMDRWMGGQRDGWRERQMLQEKQTCSNVYFKALDEAQPVVSWLRQQPRVNGGYTSTQVSHPPFVLLPQAAASFWSRSVLLRLP